MFYDDGDDDDDDKQQSMHRFKVVVVCIRYNTAI